jgi:hypothetical protein
MRRLLLLSGLLLAACASPGGGDKVNLPAAPRPGEPAGLVGLSSADMRANFGTPAFVRKDGIVELWRYDDASCKAFFFLYAESGTNRVRHVETLPRGNSTTAADPACLELFLKRRVSQPVS